MQAVASGGCEQIQELGRRNLDGTGGPVRSAVRQLSFFDDVLIGLAGKKACQFVMAFARFGGKRMAGPALLLGRSAGIITVV